MTKELKVGSKVKNKNTGVTRTITGYRAGKFHWMSKGKEGVCKAESMKKWASGNN